MSIAIRVGLEEDSAQGILRGVSSNGKWFGKVREMTDRV